VTVKTPPAASCSSVVASLSCSVTYGMMASILQRASRACAPATLRCDPFGPIKFCIFELCGYEGSPVA